MAVFRAGADVDSYCGHCGLELAHVIVAMDGAKPARVQCKTCHTVHGYRRSGVAARAKATSAPARRAPSTRKKAPAEPGLDELLRGRNLNAAKPYQMVTSFGPNDLVRHTQFGLGVVVGTPSGDKVQVLFPSGLKILAHAHSA